MFCSHIAKRFSQALYSILQTIPAYLRAPVQLVAYGSFAKTIEMG
jgi:hypothetical protein